MNRTRLLIGIIMMSCISSICAKDYEATVGCFGEGLGQASVIVEYNSRINVWSSSEKKIVKNGEPNGTTGIDKSWGVYFNNRASYEATPAAGSVFKGWYSEDKETFQTQTNPMSLNSSMDKTHNYGTYYAKFDIVSIQNDPNCNPIPLQVTGNPNGTVTGTVTFISSDANSKDDFAPIAVKTNGEGQWIVTDWSYDTSTKKVNVTYQYTADNRHYTNQEATATITLHSANMKVSKSVNVSANVDLTPTFSITPTTYTFGEIEIGSSERQTIAITPTNEVAKAAGFEWTYTITGDIGEFAVEPNGLNAVVLFAPITTGDKTATITITGQYTDANETIIEQPTPQVITLTAKAKTPDVTKIIFGGDDNYVHWMATAYVGVTATENIPVALLNVSNVQYTWKNNPDNLFSDEIGSKAGQISISLTPNNVGDYSANDKVAVLTATGITADGQTITKDLTIKVRCELVQPVLNVYSGFQCQTLEWNSIAGVRQYIISRDGQTFATIDDGNTTSYSVASLTNGTTYKYQLTVVASNTDFNKSSNEVTSTVGTLTEGKHIGLQTGTIGHTKKRTGFSSYSPYYTRRDIDVTAAFDEDGNALFDYMYVFGPTDPDGTTTTETYTGEDGIKQNNVPKINVPNGVEQGKSGRLECNAKTMCYVFERNGSTYVYKSEFNAVKQRLGTLTNGKSYYFTGFCPFVCTGTKSTEEGFAYAEGQNTSVDIYLDNCIMYSKNKTATGASHASDYETYNVVLSIGNNKLDGFASPFVFYSTGAKFSPKIHIINHNELRPSNGNLMTKVNASHIKDIYTNRPRYCAPITCKTNEDGENICSLTLDDIWPKNSISTYHTNGFLELMPNITNTGSIDLGNDKGEVSFNGGQYVLCGSYEVSDSYASSLAISYRKFTLDIDVKLVTVSVSLWHFGGDQADSKVTINGGTFNVSQWQSQSSYAYEKTDLRLPQNSVVNGGTFNNCDVYTCSDAASNGTQIRNTAGDYLCRFQIATSGQNSDGTAQFTFPPLYAEYEPLYGKYSINADKNGDVWLLLPGEKNNCEYKREVPIYNYVYCMGSITGSSNGYDVNIGGDKEAHSGNSDVVRNNYLAYITYDERMQTLANNKTYKATLGNLEVPVEISALSASITNTDDYYIQRGLYVAMPIHSADEWFLFTAPFNIQKVYVVETYCEKELNKAGLAREEALNKQAYYNLDMGYNISYGKIAAEPGPNKSLITLMNSYLNTRRNQAKDAYPTENIGANDIGIWSLTHYNGSNIRNAHYYLYDTQDWEFEEGKFTTHWQCVPEQTVIQTEEKENIMLMQQGHTYALYFPYFIGHTIDANGNVTSNNQHDKWDYWTGKYLIFEGKGPQMVRGEDALEIEEPNAGFARLVGNYTFANYSPEGTTYKLNASTEMFEATSTTDFRPTEGLLLVNIDAPAGQRVQSVSRLGKVIYGPAITTDNEDSHIPTIAGNATLMVQLADGGMEVMPLQTQHVEIVSADGRLIYSGTLSEQTYFAVPAGLYLVRGEYEVLKVMVK